jgi:hypothetical protein
MLGWLRRALGVAPVGRQTLQHWQQDADFAGIRDPDAVATMQIDEQEACKKLWADVEAVLKRVEEKKL